MNMDAQFYEQIKDELKILRIFYKTISDGDQYGNPISESKFIKDTEKHLKVSLRISKYRCTCNRRRYDICEVCQASGSELITLRNFFRVISKAKLNNMTDIEIQEFIENTKKQLAAN